MSKRCPHCSEKWNGIIGPGGSHSVTELEKRDKYLVLPTNDETVHYTFDVWVCPKCGYAELCTHIPH